MMRSSVFLPRPVCRYFSAKFPRFDKAKENNAKSTFGSFGNKKDSFGNKISARKNVFKELNKTTDSSEKETEKNNVVKKENSTSSKFVRLQKSSLTNRESWNGAKKSSNFSKPGTFKRFNNSKEDLKLGAIKSSLDNFDPKFKTKNSNPGNSEKEFLKDDLSENLDSSGKDEFETLSKPISENNKKSEVVPDWFFNDKDKKSDYSNDSSSLLPKVGPFKRLQNITVSPVNKLAPKNPMKTSTLIDSFLNVPLKSLRRNARTIEALTKKEKLFGKTTIKESRSYGIEKSSLNPNSKGLSNKTLKSAPVAVEVTSNSEAATRNNNHNHSILKKDSGSLFEVFEKEVKELSESKIAISEKNVTTKKSLATTISNEKSIKMKRGDDKKVLNEIDTEVLLLDEIKTSSKSDFQSFEKQSFDKDKDVSTKSINEESVRHSDTYSAETNKLKENIKVAENVKDMFDDNEIRNKLTNRGRRRIERLNLQKESPLLTDKELENLPADEKNKYLTTLNLLEKIENNAPLSNPFVEKASSCNGCGAVIQVKFPRKPGFMSPDRFEKLLRIKEQQRNIKKIVAEREAMLLNPDKNETKSDEVTVSEELKEETKDEILSELKIDQKEVTHDIKLSDSFNSRVEAEIAAVEALENMAPLTASDLQIPNKSKKKQIVCNRCHHLIHYSGDRSDTPNIELDDFSALLRNEFHKKDGDSHVIIKLVDIFDFQGSIIPDFNSIVTPRNPVILAVNKVDLCPTGVKHQRIIAWSKFEMKKAGIRVSDIILLSGATGEGCQSLMERAAQATATSRNSNVYVVGTANVGKSTLINKLIKQKYGIAFVLTTGKGQRAVFDPVTVSSKPGTTLGLVPFALSHKYSEKPLTLVYDTPGVMVKDHLWSKLDPQELESILPKESIKPVTYRLAENHTIMLGSCVTITLTTGRPFFFTIFSSKEITVHVTENHRVQDLINNHAGKLIMPPFHINKLKEFSITDEKYPFKLRGDGWMRSSHDIVFPGLGWVAITGVGEIDLSVQCMEGMKPVLRSPLLPFESQTSIKKYHGLRS